MKYITGTKDFKFTNTIITLGKFDGLHKGHRKLIDLLVQEESSGYTSVVLSFDIPPKKLISGEDTRYILTKEEKRIFHEESGIDVLIEYPFDKETSVMDAGQFVSDVLVGKLDVKKIVCGTDFKFGRDRLGDIHLLKELGIKYGFEVIVFEKEIFEYKEISSTAIKEEIELGNIEKVNSMLGYPFTVIGEVVYGKQLGRMLGSPTLNILPPDSKILPPNGVYLTKTLFDGEEYDSITNIGCKPTVSNEMIRGIETHLFDYEGDLYGRKIEVQFFKFVRGEKKFGSVEELKTQIFRDIEVCKGIVKS